MKAKYDWLLITMVFGGLYLLGHICVFIGYQLAELFTRG